MSRYDDFYRMIRLIPRGKVATYGQIAELAGYPRCARQVGYALAGMPEDPALPWQRVINSEGRISLADSADRAEQRRLLLLEGVEVSLEGRVELTRFRWQPDEL